MTSDGDEGKGDDLRLTYFLVTSDIAGPRVVQDSTKIRAIESYRSECGVSEEVAIAVRLASDIEVSLASQSESRASVNRGARHYSTPKASDSRSDTERRLYGLDAACGIEIDRFTH